MNTKIPIVVRPADMPALETGWTLAATWKVSLGVGRDLLRISNRYFPVQAPAQIPSAPANLQLTVQSATAIALQWADNSSNASGFVVQRRAPNSSTWNLVTTTPTGMTTFIDTSLQAGTQYSYRVLAVNDAGYSAESNVVSATTPTLPLAPSNLSLTVQTSTSIQLKWSDNSSNESGFLIERLAAGSNTWTSVTTAAANASNYTDNSALPNTQYSYRVSAVNNAGNSAPSNVATGSTLIVRPAAPGNLALTVQSSNAIGLTWTDNSNNETGFKIERQTGDGTGTTWTVVATTVADVTSYSDGTAQPQTRYAYRVSAVNSAGASGVSNVVSGTTPSAVYLTPGTTGPGSWAATTQPATQGQVGQTGYTATAIARWDVVPYQTFAGNFNVGVVAFDIAGIDHVAFSVNGGPWTNVSQMTLNPQTNVVEYWATMRAGDFAQDGAVEVRAIAYPKVGVPRVLQGSTVSPSGNQSVTLYANGQGTLPQQILWVSTTGSDSTGDGSQGNPFASIVKAVRIGQSGASIYVAAGTYQFASVPGAGNLNDRWITITPAPGIARSAVIIQPRQVLTVVNHLKLVNVTIDCTLGGDLTGLVQSLPDNQIWLDQCNISSSLSYLDHDIAAPVDIATFAAAYITNSAIYDYPGRAGVGLSIIRNVQVKHISDDAFDNPQLVLNASVDDLKANFDWEHLDAFQWFANYQDANSIIYNVKVTNVVDGQLIFGPIGQNLAVVNFLGTSTYSDATSNVFGDHLLFYNVTLPQQNLLLNTDFTCTNISVIGCALWRLYGNGSGISVTASHIIDLANESGGSYPVGEFTSGDPGFVSVPGADGKYDPNGDFHLSANSLLLHRIAIPLVSVDLDGLKRPLLDSIGAY